MISEYASFCPKEKNKISNLALLKKQFSIQCSFTNSKCADNFTDPNKIKLKGNAKKRDSSLVLFLDPMAKRSWTQLRDF